MEIKFRGKSKNDGNWVNGDLHSMCNNPHIHIDWTHKSVIDMSTVGQFTGIKDKNGIEIFDGDIISSEKGVFHLILYREDLARFVAYYNEVDYCSIDQEWINEFSKVVIGNRYDNPKLLKEILHECKTVL